jgi:hypothetical protein
VDWARLPEPVRGRLAEVAATAVGELPPADVPLPLRRFARFTPAKRARLGGPALVAELAASDVFRTAVVAWWHEHRPASSCRTPTTCARPRPPPSWPGTRRTWPLAEAARRGEVGELRAELDAALSRVDKLTLETERLRGELGEAREQARTAGEARDAEYQQLRRRVSEQGAKLRTALDALGAAEEAAAERARAAEEELARARAERDRERARAEAERRRADRAPPRWRRPGRRPARPARPTRCGWACSSTRSAARWPGCAASWRSAAAGRAPATWSRVRRRRRAAVRSTGSPGWTPCWPCRPCT